MMKFTGNNTQGIMNTCSKFQVKRMIIL